MGAKKVSANFPAQDIEIGTKGVEFKVMDGAETMGRLRVGKARLTWIPKNSTYGYQLPWERVRDLFVEHGVKENE